MNPNTDHPRCTDCAHMVMRDHREMCNSPQVRAGYGGATAAIFERDSFDKEFNRDMPATRKCGPAGINWTRKGVGE